MHIQTNDGLMLTGTATEIIAQLREAAHLPTLTDTEYMADVSQRMGLWNGGNVRTSSAQAFLEDLEQAGVIVRMRDC